MVNYLKNFFNEFDYPNDSHSVLMHAYEKITQNEEADLFFKSTLQSYSKDVNCNYKDILEKCEKISKKLEVHEYTVKLVLFICLSKYTKEHYIKHGYSQELWHQTFLDLRYKLIECKLVKGIDGTYVANWLCGFVDLTRFGFKRLQFEIRGAKCDYSKNGKSLKANDPVINVHIPRTGTPLSPSEFEDDFKTAAEFFKNTFNCTPIAFVCHSWLLFEKMRKFLSQNSNIIAFMNKFDILYTDYLEQGNYNQIWRLFDVEYTGNLDDLPENTSLRRAYKQYLKDGGKWGAGYGIFFA